MIHRRRLLKTAALGSGAGSFFPFHAGRGSGEKMKIVEIEEHEVVPPFHDYNAETLFRYHGLSLQTRVIYVVRTDVGLEGYGESGGPLRKGRLQGLPWHRSVRLDGGHQEPAHEHGRLRPHGEISGSARLEAPGTQGALLDSGGGLDRLAASQRNGRGSA